MSIKDKIFDGNVTSALAQYALITEHVGQCAQALIRLRGQHATREPKGTLLNALDETESHYKAMSAHLQWLQENLEALRENIADEGTEDGDES